MDVTIDSVSANARTCRLMAGVTLAGSRNGMSATSASSVRNARITPAIPPARGEDGALGQQLADEASSTRAEGPPDGQLRPHGSHRAPARSPATFTHAMSTIRATAPDSTAMVRPYPRVVWS